jgi:regulator of RNase E activity RraA
MFPQARSVAGRARTLRFMPAREDLGDSPAGPLNRQLIDSLQPGDIMVVDALGSDRGSVLGDMLATRVKRRGAAAMVTDGVIRDSQAMAELGLPVFARGIQPDPASSFMVPWEVDVPVHCAGCLIMPGEWILADADAVLVLPNGFVERMIQDAERMMAEESLSQKLLEAGFPLDEAYPLPPGRQADLQRYIRDGALPSGEEFQSRPDD